MEIQETAAGTLVSKFFNIPVILAIFLVALLLATANNYGIFRDELYYIACGEHLDFGYVDQPPLVALLTRLSLILFGNSLLGLRLFPALAGAATVLLAAVIAKELGGGKFAQGLASLTILAAMSLSVFFGTMSMNPFEVLIWTICAYLLIRILNGASPKLWLLFGLVAGIGLQNKHSMLVFGFAVVVGLLLTRQRRLLASPWPWLGGLIAALIFLPNLIWQAANGWPTLEFLRNAQLYKNYPVSPLDFLLQLTIALNPLTMPIWIAGLLFFFFGKDAAKYRTLGIMFVACFVVFVLQRSKFYYIVPAIPLLLAAGAVAIERLTRRIGWKWLNPAIAFLLVISGGFLTPLALPILPVESFISFSQTIGMLENIRTERHEQVALPQHFADRFGWREMAETVAEVYNGLPEEEKAKCAIFTRNYGEAGAIDYFGPELGLPNAICGHNSYWFWGPRDYSGEVVICFGYSREWLEEHFAQVEEAAVIGHRYAMAYETNLPVYICRQPLVPLPDLWPDLKYYI